MIVIVLKIKVIHLILTLLFITKVYSLTESVCSPEKDCWFFVSNNQYAEKHRTRCYIDLRGIDLHLNQNQSEELNNRPIRISAKITPQITPYPSSPKDKTTSHIKPKTYTI